MKKRKFWLVLMSVITAIVLIFVGTFMLTKLSNVSVEFTSRLAESETRLDSGVLENVRTTGEFDFKKSIIILNMDEHIAKIEKSNPYVKVEKVVRKFPNKINVYISERIPKYRIRESSTSTKWYILDKDFKVLEQVETAELSSKKLLNSTVEVLYVSQKTYIGDFLDLQKQQSELNEIMSGVYAITEDYFAVKSIDYNESEHTFSLTMRQSGDYNYEGGCILQIVGTSNLKELTAKATYVYTGNDAENPLTGLDLSKKVIIINNGSSCIVKNQEE